VSFGLSEWGLSVWGVDPSLYLESAVALTTHAVLVTVSQPMLMSSPLGTGDALNPATWSVERDDNSFAWTIVGCSRVTDRRVILYLRTALQSWNRTHVVRTTELRSFSGAFVVSPYELNFRGVLPTTAINEPRVPFDLASTDINAGGLRTTEAGGYERVFGNDLIRKMALRRLTTMPGAYFHIPPADFGRDMKVKEVIRASSILALKTAIELEMLKEPDVIGAKASLTMSNGLLEIRLKIQTDINTVEVGLTAG
jgi:hypothetical protein